MMSEEDKLVGLLDKAELESALKHASGMSDKESASQVLSDYAVSLIRNLYSYGAAQALLDHAVSLNPRNHEAHYNLGVLYTEPELYLRDPSNPDRAEKAYLRAIKIKPEYMQAHYNLALLYHLLGRVDEAELEYQVFSKLCKDKEFIKDLKNILSRKIRNLKVEDL